MKFIGCMSYLLILCSFSILYSQTVFVVHRSKTFGNKISQLEELIITNTVNLYNIKNNNELKLSFKNHPSFVSIITALNNVEKSDSIHVVMNSLTITKKRQDSFLFSSAYLPVKNVLIYTKEREFNSKLARRIGFIKHSIQEDLIKLNPHETDLYIGFDSYRKMESGLLEKKIDFMITDNVDTWNNERLKIYKVLPEQIGSGYGIMFLKASVYKDKLEKYFRYFLKSPSFKKEVYNLYGKEIADYFVKELRLM